MRAYGQKSDPVRLWGRRLLIIALFVLVLLVGGGVWSIYHKEIEAKANGQAAAAALADLKERQIQLGADIAKLKTNSGVEAELRQQYELGRSGEGLIVIVDTPVPPVAPKAAFPSLQWLKDTFSKW